MEWGGNKWCECRVGVNGCLMSDGFFLCYVTMTFYNRIPKAAVSNMSCLCHGVCDRNDLLFKSKVDADYFVTFKDNRCQDFKSHV